MDQPACCAFPIVLCHYESYSHIISRHKSNAFFKICCCPEEKCIYIFGNKELQLNTKPVYSCCGRLVDLVDKALNRFSDFLHGVKKHVVNDRLFHPPPESLDEVEFRAIWQREMGLVFRQERLNQCCVMDFGIVQDENDFLIGVFLQQFLQEG